MKIFLIQNAQLDQLKAPQRHGADDCIIVPFLVPVTPSSIRPLYKQDPEEVQLCNSLRQEVESGGDPMGLLICELAPTDYLTPGRVCFRVLSSPLTKTLVDLLGENARIQVSVTKLRIQGNGELDGFETSRMKIQDGFYACQSTDLEHFFQRDPQYDILEAWLRNSVTTLEFQGLMMVTVSDVDPSAPVVTDKMQVNRKMLQEEIGSDLVIILGNGKEVRAHKGVLGAHSDVFKAMFQSDMKEAKTDTVEIPDMSEEAVRALLAFLYCWDDSVPKVKPEVALEMLQAGHKYDIPVLETDMKNLLLAKPANWYDGDDALKLFLFARNLPKDGDGLKMKAIGVMKTNFENFKKSPTYAALFKEDPGTAMEICSYFAAS